MPTQRDALGFEVYSSSSSSKKKKKKASSSSSSSAAAAGNQLDYSRFDNIHLDNDDDDDDVAHKNMLRHSMVNESMNKQPLQRKNTPEAPPISAEELDLSPLEQMRADLEKAKARLEQRENDLRTQELDLQSLSGGANGPAALIDFLMKQGLGEEEVEKAFEGTEEEKKAVLSKMMGFDTNDEQDADVDSAAAAALERVNDAARMTEETLEEVRRIDGGAALLGKSRSTFTFPKSKTEKAPAPPEEAAAPPAPAPPHEPQVVTRELDGSVVVTFYVPAERLPPGGLSDMDLTVDTRRVTLDGVACSLSVDVDVDSARARYLRKKGEVQVTLQQAA